MSGDSRKAWVRIEPRCRLEAFAQGLEARTADGLWFLARQWQMGEFLAEDAGSAIAVDLEYQSIELTHLRRGANAEFAEITNKLPPEVLVEREPLVMDWRTRVRLGQQLERFFRKHLNDQADAVICEYRRMPRFRVTYPTDSAERATDLATRRFLRLMEGRVINGEAIRLAWQVTKTPPLLPVDVVVDQAKLEAAFQDWDDWYARLYVKPEEGETSAWKPQELEYEFQVQAKADNTEAVLVAPDYRNGEFDWYTCDVLTPPSIDHLGAARKKTFYPTRVGFTGKANERWWAFEDHQVRFDWAKSDIDHPAKLILTEFALIYGDDWLYVPVEVPVGSLVQVTGVVVHNVFGEVFGEKVPIRLARDSGVTETERWELFTLSELGSGLPPSTHPWLFVPPSVGHREESPALEEVRFHRDEGANMVFAIEHTIQDQLGRPVGGFEAQIERRQRAEVGVAAEDGARDIAQEGGASSAMLRYRLSTSVPDNWIPFVPVSADGSGLPNTDEASIRLRRAAMLRNESDQEPAVIAPMSGILASRGYRQTTEWLNEESISRAGLKVVLNKQRVRWTDGKTYVWLGRKVLIPEREGNSGLRFDVAVNRGD